MGAVSSSDDLVGVIDGGCARLGAPVMCGGWLKIVKRQGERFFSCAAEDGGRLFVRRPTGRDRWRRARLGAPVMCKDAELPGNGISGVVITGNYR